MKLSIFSVRDSAVNAFLQPFFAPTKGAAIRMFSDAVSDSSHQFAKHKDDYVLWEIGEFDDANGLMSPIEPSRVIGAIEVAE